LIQVYKPASTLYNSLFVFLTFAVQTRTTLMPLLLISRPFADASFGLWQIAEDEAFFRNDMPLAAQEEAELAAHHNPLRRLEWLAGRWLLHKLTDVPQRLQLAKDAFSKPFFPENQHLACSLSHSKGIVGALIVESDKLKVTSTKLKVASDKQQVASDKQQVASDMLHIAGQASTVNGQLSIGCDIQVVIEKMTRIAHKFLNEPEKAYVESRPKAEYLQLLHLFWTAKESLYKAYGLKELDFRKNLFVDHIEWDGQTGTGSGRVEKGAFQQEFQLIFNKIEVFEKTELIWTVAFDC
jgi:4'-phosphopantetheinyl transferase